jgi:transposase
METRETITLDGRAQVRLTILTDVLAGALSPEEAAMSLGCSTRQVRRLAVAYRARGAAALVHGNRGRVPANRIADERRARIVELATTTLAGFNATHVADILAEEHPELAISGKSVLRILAAAGLGPTKRRRRPRHRSRRERMPRAGMLLQADGSRHDWLEGRGPWLTLVGAVDDATGVMTGAIFREQEDAAGYFTVLAQTVARFGLPWPSTPTATASSSRTPTGRSRSPSSSRADEPRPSSDGRSRRSRCAGSRPRALRPRVVPSEAGARPRIASCPSCGAPGPAHSPRPTPCSPVTCLVRRPGSGVPAADDEAAWRPWPSLHPVEAELCFHYPRRVAGDATLAWEGRDLALPRRHDGRSWKRRRVTVEEHLDGSLWVRDVAERHRLSEAPASTPRLRARSGRRISPLEILPEPVRAPVPRAPSAASVVSRPIPDHPWRRYAGPRPR